MSYAKVGKYSIADPALSSNEADYLRVNTRGESIAVISGTTGNLVQATTNNALVATLIGATGNLVRATTDQSLRVALVGSTGGVVGQTTDGALKVSGISVTLGSYLPVGTTALASGTLGLTSNSTQLASRAARTLWLQNDPDNVVDVLLGASSDCVMQLSPGDSATLDVENKNLVWAKAVSSTATLNWMAQTS